MREQQSNQEAAKYARMYYLHTLTPLHVGVGRGVGFIDLPILREKVTGWPIVPGTAVKGVLADYHKADEQGRKANPKLSRAFGSGGDDNANSGALVMTDARIICLPVRSYYGTFAWVTSPDALSRYARDLEAAGQTAPKGLPKPAENKAAVPADPATALAESGNIYFEDLDFTVASDGAAGDWAKFLAAQIFPQDGDWQNVFRQRFAVVHGDVFNFLCDTGTEVQAHVRIDDARKTVAKGALWYEECLPAEAVLAGLVWCDRVFGNGNGTKPEELLSDYASGEHALQIGGKATVGKGRVRCIFSNGGMK
ncbi:MAG: type III-B CRISPR module RAMP protein Cmr4 [Candidatus Sumerlaeaceae bacterium]|nr:type III-B CRISPR module RAMP protein Cmr4 [Candidatus Sumerlaeaceae bacterium]